MKVNMDPEAKILDDYKYYPTEIKDHVFNEQVEMNRELSSCDTTSLYHLIVEESGVEVIRYTWPSSEGHWYQIFTPNSIQKLELTDRASLD